MITPELVTEEKQVIENIINFEKELHRPGLRDMIAYVRHWYAIQTERNWRFGPSKFIGYSSMNYESYERSHDKLDGRATEYNLKQWFIELDKNDKLGLTLLQQVRRLAAQHGKTINALARIHVLKGEGGHTGYARKSPGNEGWRITSDPGILAGKPCIRGMRIRVADILEMLVHGATRREILDDYPYLEDGDITAALEFAMGAVDHRLIKAA